MEGFERVKSLFRLNYEFFRNNMSGKRKRRKSKCKNFDHKKQKNKPFDEKMESSVNCEAREVGECDSGCSPHEYSFNGFVVIPERQKFFDQIKIGLHERQFVLVQVFS